MSKVTVNAYESLKKFFDAETARKHIEASVHD